MEPLRHTPLAAAFGLALSLCAAPGLAQEPAQEPAPPGAPRLAPPSPEALDGPVTGPGGRVEEWLMPESADEREATRRKQLDELFKQLAEEDNPHWQAIQTQIFIQWRQSGSASMDFLLQRGLEAMEAGDLDTALLHLDDLVRLAPDFAEGWNQRATVHFLRDDYGYAMADIQRALALEPRHFGAMAGLGVILDRTGNEAGALRAFRRVLELHPQMPGARQGVKRLAPKVDGREL